MIEREHSEVVLDALSNTFAHKIITMNVQSRQGMDIHNKNFFSR